MFALLFGSIRAQSTDSLRSDFIQWRISEFLKTDCHNSSSIQIEDSFEPWSSEKKFVDNYLIEKDQNQLEAMWSKDEKSYEILDSLRSILNKKDYSEIAAQLSQTTNQNNSDLGIYYNCDGNGQPVTFKLTKPIVIQKQNLIIVTEKVYYQNNKCTARQITSYKKIDSKWVEFLNFFRSNVCL